MVHPLFEFFSFLLPLSLLYHHTARPIILPFLDELVNYCIYLLLIICYLFWHWNDKRSCIWQLWPNQLLIILTVSKFYLFFLDNFSPISYEVLIFKLSFYIECIAVLCKFCWHLFNIELSMRVIMKLQFRVEL